MKAIIPITTSSTALIIQPKATIKNTMKEPAFIYLLANEAHTALYTGSTTCSKFYTWYQRVKYQPKTFSAPYVFEKLVYFEMFADHAAAIRREKELKTLSRIMQRRLVSSTNEEWENLLESFVQEMERMKLV